MPVPRSGEQPLSYLLIQRHSPATSATCSTRHQHAARTDTGGRPTHRPTRNAHVNANEMEEKKQKNKEECNSQPANQFLYRLSQSWRPTRICKLRGQPCNNAERKAAVRVSQTEGCD